MDEMIHDPGTQDTTQDVGGQGEASWELRDGRVPTR